MSDRTILLVDDDELLSEFTVMLLESIGGYSIEYCTSGNEALAVIDKITPHIFLLDLNMPEMDGIELYHHIRSNDHFKNSPLLFLTGMHEEDKITELLQLGASGVLVKPLTEEALVQGLRRLEADNFDQK